MPSFDQGFNLWKSPRLIYRAIEPSTDDGLVEGMESDLAGYANSHWDNIHFPAGTDASDKKCNSQGQLLSAIICLQARGIVPDPDHTPIGYMELIGNDPRVRHHRNSDLAITIIPKFQRKGYGTEAIAWALDYAFRSAGLHRVTLRVVGYNTAAIRLYQRIGFSIEGRRREAIWWEGKFWDDHMYGKAMLVRIEGEFADPLYKRYGMLETEWPAHREKLGAKGAHLRELPYAPNSLCITVSSEGDCKTKE